MGNLNIFENSIEKPRVFTIDSQFSFLNNLAQVLINNINDKSNGLDFSDALIILPTRRAARELQGAFLRVNNNASMILPRIRTIGDLDFDDANINDLSVETLNQRPINSLQRRLYFANQVRLFNSATGWNQDIIAALSGADALIDIIEAMELLNEGEEEINWNVLETLVDKDNLAQHWQNSLEFLKIVTQFYPQFLQDNDIIDNARFRRMAIDALCHSFKNNPPNYPVIIAGSTGAIPATRRLMKIVARLPKGAIVLPGLDKDLDEEAWEQIEHEDGHPQRILFDTINYIGIRREEVKIWPTNLVENSHFFWRRRILNEALRPKEGTKDWLSTIDKIKRKDPNAIIAAFDGLSLIEAETEEQEASAIAIEMRATLENKDETCALITPNLNIANRVSQKMARWGVKLDSSSGVKIFETPLGNYIKTICNFITQPSDPINIMALLSSKFIRINNLKYDYNLACASLEIGVFRNSRKFYSLENISESFANLHPKAFDYKGLNKFAAKDLIDNLIKIQSQIGNIKNDDNLSQICTKIIEYAEVLAGGGDYLWLGQSGFTLAQTFGEIIENGHNFTCSKNDGIKILNYILSELVIRPNNAHPRLAILGPLEARLLNYDKIILAGLDEGIWPQPTKNDPFLSNGMRNKIGLISNELRMGLSAHDFLQMASKPNVIITRAKRRCGSPCVSSRWLWRLQILCEGAEFGRSIELLSNTGFNSLEISKAAIEPYSFRTKDIIPRPIPPISSRPTEFFATEIETFIRDPYKTYVTKILEIRPLDDLGGDVSAKERGSAIHKALEIIKNWPESFPDNPEQALLDEFEKRLSEYGFEKAAIASELTRLIPSAKIMANRETQRIKGGVIPLIEKKFSADFDFGGHNLKLSAKIDRIDIFKDGLEIWDFKTGTVPSNKQINQLFATQLPVTTLIINANKDFFDNKKVSGFGHIKLGGRNPKIEMWNGAGVKDKSIASVDELLEELNRAMTQLCNDYSDENRAYISKPFVQFLHTNYEDIIDRLARRREWADFTDTSEGNFDD